MNGTELETEGLKCSIVYGLNSCSESKWQNVTMLAKRENCTKDAESFECC